MPRNGAKQHVCTILGHPCPGVRPRNGVAARFPADAERLKRELSRWWNSDRFVCETDAETCDENRPVDQETTEQLKALGYL